MKNTTKSIKVNKNIPMPTTLNKAKYPWRDMEIGDSFLVTEVSRACISAQCSITAVRLGMKFTTAAVEGGTRVWRVK